MNILAIDCSTNLLNVSITTGESFHTIVERSGLKHSKRLVPYISNALAMAELKVGQLDLLGLAQGPGSFTGLRIAFSTLRGMSVGLNRPLAAVPSLDVYARHCQQHYSEGLVVPVINARKNRFYSALYEKGKRITDFLDIEPEALLEKTNVHEHVIITGPDSIEFYSQWCKAGRFHLHDCGSANYGMDLATSIEEQFTKEGPVSTSDGPLYIRKSEAELHKGN